MRALRVIWLLLLGAVFGRAALAHAQLPDRDGPEEVQTIRSTQVKSTALTIYPDNLTLVRETRVIDLPVGIVDIQFFGVTDMIIPQSAVLEQFEGLRIEGNFDSDLITPAKLLTQSVGDMITIRRLNPVTGASDLVSAELISAAPNAGRGQRGINAVFSTVDGVEGFQCSGLPEAILLSKLPEGMHSVPVLSTRVVTDTPGPKEITLTYLTRGLEWGADYRMDVTDGKLEASLLGWLTLNNQTSKSFKDTQLSFVAGALNQVNRDRQSNNKPEWDRVATCVLDEFGTSITRRVITQEASTRMDGVAYFSGGGGGDDEIIVTAARRATVREATQEDLGDYKLYRAPQAVSVNAYQSKQIAFLFKDEVEFEHSYSWTLSDLEEIDDIDTLIDDEIPLHSRLTYEIDNDKDGPLAVPLPRGSLRAMSQTQNGTDIFLGEGNISNTPVGQTADVKVADSFLITARFYDLDERKENIVAAKVKLKNATDRAVKTEFDFDIFETIAVRQNKRRKLRPVEGKLYSFTIPAEGTVDFSFEGKLR